MPDYSKQLRRLEKHIKELNQSFTKNDQALRRTIRDLRINQTAATCAMEYTLANKLGITMDVVLKMLPPESSAAIQREIDRRVAECPDTTAAALILAADLYDKNKDDY